MDIRQPNRTPAQVRSHLNKPAGDAVVRRVTSPRGLPSTITDTHSLGRDWALDHAVSPRLRRARLPFSKQWKITRPGTKSAFAAGPPPAGSVGRTDDVTRRGRRMVGGGSSYLAVERPVAVSAYHRLGAVADQQRALRIPVRVGQERKVLAAERGPVSGVRRSQGAGHHEPRT